MTTRRQLLVGVGVFLAVSRISLAQQAAKIPHVGVLMNGTSTAAGHLVEAFSRGLSELGYTIGKNIVLEIRYGDGDPARLPALAKELVDLKVDAFYAANTLTADAIRKTGTHISIVFSGVGDPISAGFVASLARPGGNMTGFANMSPEISAKRVQIVHEAFPNTGRLAVMYARDTTPSTQSALVETTRAAKILGKDVMLIQARQRDEIAGAFAKAAKSRVGAMLVVEDPMFFNNRHAIVELAAKYRMPTMYPTADYTAAGGLVSYGADYRYQSRRAAAYVDKVLKGTPTADMPVELPTKFELALNMKTAKMLELEVPQLLLRADKVIN